MCYVMSLCFELARGRRTRSYVAVEEGINDEIEISSNLGRGNGPKFILIIGNKYLS